jgi:hypothetical protein
MGAGTQPESLENRLRRRLEQFDPFLAPQLIAAATVVLDFAMPDRLGLIKPAWIVPGAEALVLLALIASSVHPRARYSRVRRRASIALIAVVTLGNCVSLVLLCHYLLHGGRAGGRALIGSGILLWCSNVLLFSLWFWQLDRGGPVARATGNERLPDFLFVQMTNDQFAPDNWRPGMVDYLYTSFTNATAFSPTDTMPLTAAAKWLMSVQALTALLTVGLVVARAVNILS